MGMLDRQCTAVLLRKMKIEELKLKRGIAEPLLTWAPTSHGYK